jgi:pSer/pThr/pTyr-binding forkhead associated (FHA) protein
MYRLTFLSGPLKGKRLAIRQGPVTIGRDPECNIAVADNEIFRKHAVIERRDDDFYIRDVGSKSGILVNDIICRESKLKHKDTITIGRTVILFQQVAKADAGEGRRVTHSQGLAFAAVICTILVQLAFVVGLSVWRRDVVKKTGKAPPASSAQQTTSVVPVASNPVAEAKAHAQTVIPAHVEETTPTGPPGTRVTQDIEKLRADVEDVRQQVKPFAKSDTSVVPAPAMTASMQRVADEEPQKKVDLLTAKAQQMLQAAQQEIANKNMAQADMQLERIQILAPNFLPSYIERARLCEQRGDLAKAGEQWREVLHRSSGTPLYEQAAAERIRLSRLEIIRNTTEIGTPDEKKRSTERLGRRIKIVSVEMQRFPENDRFEEMRLLRITLKPKSGERSMDLSEIRVDVLFFDEETFSRDVNPTRVVVPKDALRLDGDWNQDGQQTVTAAYIVPKHFRKKELEKYGQKCAFLGYLAQVYYREQLQDEDARPKALLQKADQFQPTRRPITPTARNDY